MQLRDSSSRSATDGADQHTRCGKGEKKTIAPETNSSGQPAPDLEERKPVVSRARARFDYVASPDDPSELSFKRGEIFDVLDSSAKWWIVKKADASTGIVPSNFVRSCDRKLDSRCQAKALYNYQAAPGQPEEVSLTKGEILDVLDDSGKWWEVRKACGWEGLAPSNYLRRLVTPGVLAEAL